MQSLEEVMSTHIHPTEPTRRLTRLEQLTLNTWRWAAATLQNTLDPSAVLELAALHAVLAALRDVEEPLALFSRHGQAQPEFQLVLSLMPDQHRLELPHDVLDTAFLLRWTELVADGPAPQELAPLPPGEPHRRRPED
jgi:hypothetical protein